MPGLITDFFSLTKKRKDEFIPTLVQELKKPDYSIKIKFISSIGAGQTSLISRYLLRDSEIAFNEKHIPTHEASIVKTRIEINGNEIEAEIWDSPALLENPSASSATTIIYLVDPTNSESLTTVKALHRALKYRCLPSSTGILVVTTKSDVQKDPDNSLKEMLDFARAIKADYSIATSAKDDTEVTEVFKLATLAGLSKAYPQEGFENYSSPYALFKEPVNTVTLKLVGAPGVGQTSFLSAYADDFFSPQHIPTLTPSSRIQSIEINQEAIRTIVWDSGRESVASQFTPDFHAVLFLVDLTNTASLENIKELYAEEISHNPNVTTLLVGTKLDQKQRTVTPEMMAELADAIKASYVTETSAKFGTNVTLAIELAIHAIFNEPHPIYEEQKNSGNFKDLDQDQSQPVGITLKK